MKYNVKILEEAEKDILDIYSYIQINDSPSNAEYVLNNLEKISNNLSDFPERGHTVPELEKIGVTSYREVHFKPYRLIYEIEGKSVFIHCVLDGRRNLQQILERRILR